MKKSSAETPVGARADNIGPGVVITRAIVGLGEREIKRDAGGMLLENAAHPPALNSRVTPIRLRPMRLPPLSP